MRVIFSDTDIGDRDENLDRLGHFSGENWSLSYVFDGFNPTEPHFVDSLKYSFEQIFTPFHNLLLAIEDILKLIDESIKSASGIGKSSVAILVSNDDSLVYMTSGDTRIYLLNENVRSIDHSKAQDMVNQGRSPAGTLNSHPYRRYLTRSISESSDINSLDINYCDKGSDVLICSDGIWSSFTTDQAIFNVNSKICAENLFNEAKVMKPNKTDNLTMMYLSN